MLDIYVRLMYNKCSLVDSVNKELIKILSNS
jgi:hypothetical protein